MKLIAKISNIQSYAREIVNVDTTYGFCIKPYVMFKRKRLSNENVRNIDFYIFI